MKKLLVLVLMLALVSTGCSAAWVTTLDSILAAAAPALINILQIVAVANGRPMNSALAAKINGDAAAIKTLASDFAHSSSASAPGVCHQLQAEVAAYQADEQLVLQVAQVSDPKTQTKIALLSNLVAGTVEAITAVIPACESTAQTSLRKSFRATPPFAVRTFTAHYNSILTAPTGNAAVDAATPKLRLHEHSTLARRVTLGMLP